VPQFVYKHSNQLTDNMSDSDESFDILRDIKPYSFEPLAKKVTDSINCEELAAASTYVHPEQPPVPPTPGPVGISLIDKSTYLAKMRVFPFSYRIISFIMKWYLYVHRSPVGCMGLSHMWLILCATLGVFLAIYFVIFGGGECFDGTCMSHIIIGI